MISFKTYLTEIAYNYSIKDFYDDERTIALMNILLGERIPVTFFDKKTGQTIIEPNKKLTKNILADLVMRWDAGNKWDLYSDVLSAEEIKNVSVKLLNALYPNHSFG